MKVLIGLGNPGSEYKNNRHNAGFMFVEKLAGGEKFFVSKKFEAEIAKKNGLLLVKPQTFMNDSGRCVRKIVDFYKLGIDDLVLAHDDLDIALGQWKVQMGVGPKVHNGVNSVEQTMVAKDFLRVRLGVDNRGKYPTSLSGADYVLQDFGKEEKEIFKEAMSRAEKELLITLGL